VWQISTLGFVLGALLAASLKTQDQIRQEQLPTTRIPGLTRAYSDLRDTTLDQKKKIAELQENLAKYQKAAAQESGNARLLSADLQKANLLAGTVAVTGPGVVVTLRDSKNLPPRPKDMSPEAYIELCKPYIIHDLDIQAVVNELRAAGAEAIAINDQRVVATTAVRCIGSTVLVNNISTNGSPVKIAAIGDPDTLQSSLTMANGVQEQYKITDPSMFSMDKAAALTLPAYAGAMPLRYAKPAPEAKAAQARKQSEAAAEAAR
jgi:uncharacterized protein YlxW (UPF0749 family)